MRIILSPAKKMKVDTDGFATQALPQFLQETETLKAAMQGLSAQQLQTLWNCNDAITRQNVERLQSMNLHSKLTPALLSYEGIAYQCMAPSVFEDGHFVTCTFGELQKGKVVEKGTLCKMARGQMVRWLAEHHTTQRQDVRQFDQLGYRFAKAYSTETNDVFIKGDF